MGEGIELDGEAGGIELDGEAGGVDAAATHTLPDDLGDRFGVVPGTAQVSDRALLRRRPTLRQHLRDAAAAAEGASARGEVRRRPS